MMYCRMIQSILLAGTVITGCQNTPVQAEPVVVETRPAQLSLARDESITVVEKGGITNTDVVTRTVNSLSANSHGLNLVQDQELASELSSWLDKPRQETLADYLDKPEIGSKLVLYHLKYLVVVERGWWGIEAQIWNLQIRELDGVINAKALVASSTTACSTDIKTWFAGSVLTMVYIPLATATVAAYASESIRANTGIGIENLENSVDGDTAQTDSYLSISETVVQNSSEAIRGVPVPCETSHTLRSNPEIDSDRLGAYLAEKFNKFPTVAGN